VAQTHQVPQLPAVETTPSQDARSAIMETTSQFAAEFFERKQARSLSCYLYGYLRYLNQRSVSANWLF